MKILRRLAKLFGVNMTTEKTYPVDKRKFLKVKLKSLAAEARIIRQEELKTRNPELRCQLASHRRMDVRKESRATHLAYAYLRGQAYARVEPRHHAIQLPVSEHKKLVQGDMWQRVSVMVAKYGPEPMQAGDAFKKLMAWRDGALAKAA